MEDCIAERQLLCAVIKRAYLDATGQGCGKRLMIDAQEWLNSRGNSPFSYIWICKQLQIDPSIIRRAVRSIAEKKLRVNRSEAGFIPAPNGQTRRDGFLDPHHFKIRGNSAQYHAQYPRRPNTRPAQRL